METFIIYAPIFEFNAFFRLNVFIYKLRQTYTDPIQVIVAIPENVIGVIPEADKLLVFSTDYMKSQKGALPDILDYLGDRNVTDTKEKFITHVNTNYSSINPENVIFYNEFLMRNIRDYILFREWYSVRDKDLASCYRRDFRFISDYIQDGNSLKPYYPTFLKIKEKYNKYFDNKTYIIITRNFSKKQPNTNTLNIIPNLPNIITKILDSGMNIVNIGFPPQTISPAHTNYHEINDTLTQDEVLALFYLSDGLLLNGENGAFMLNACSLNDVFLLSTEWAMSIKMNLKHVIGVSICDDRKKYYSSVESISLVDLVLSGKTADISKIFLEHESAKTLEFAKQQPTERIC